MSKLPSWNGLFTRMLAGLLVTSIPVALVLTVVLTNRASTSLSDAAQKSQFNLALGASLRLDTWLTERQDDVVLVASGMEGHLGPDAVPTLQHLSVPLADEFDSLLVVGADGKLITGTGNVDFDPGSEAWFQRSLRQELITPIALEVGTVIWAVAAPVPVAAGAPAAVVVGDLKLNRLSEVLADFTSGNDPSRELHIVDSNHKLLYTSAWGAIKDDTTLIGNGTLRVSETNQAVDGGLAGQSGALRMTDYRGQDVISGYAPVASVGWVLIASELASTALAPISSQVVAAGLVALLAIAFTVLVAILLAKWIGHGLKQLSSRASASAGRLSSAAEELAAATAEQTAAATETSASMEELARTSNSIAETLERVSVQAQETRENLEQAQADAQASGQRTLALSERVNDVGDILGLINEVADQTNLLALNAAIEAARAGESGRGFAVVADEVRRLAERSKSSAARISKIIESARSESNATVMAMEQSAKQLERGLKLMEDVVEASSHVQVITHQQRSATDQVVEAMEQIAAGSRQVATTAQEISRAASSHAGLAQELDHIAGNANGLVKV